MPVNRSSIGSQQRVGQPIEPMMPHRPSKTGSYFDFFIQNKF